MTDPSQDRLDSWKEIGVFLNRGVRTVQRWEATEGVAWKQTGADPAER